MLVALAGDCLRDALTEDTDKVLETLVSVCDRIVMTEKMRKHYQSTLIRTFRTLIPQLEQLRENYQPPKVVAPRRHGRIDRPQGLPKQHDVVFKEALVTGVDYLVTKRQAWLDLARQLPKRASLRIVEPAEYVSERRLNS